MSQKGLIAIATALLISACSSTSTAPPLPLDRSFSASGLGMSDGSKIEIYMKAQPAESGVVRVCGAWRLDSQSPIAGRVAENFLYGAKVYLEDVEVLKRLSFFNEIEPDGSLAGQESSCRDSNVPWEPRFANSKLHPVFKRQAFSR